MNKSIKLRDKEFIPYKTMDEIESAIDVLAQKVNAYYQDTEQPLVMLVTLSGAMFFASELSKRLDIMIEWAFVKCSSYGSSTTSSGKVKFQLEPTGEIKGRDVLVVEDIVDTGNTWVALHNYLMEQEAKTVKIASLTIKEDVYDKNLPVDFVALPIEDKFVVGCGLDYDDLGRNINGIYQITSC